jgi:phosphoglucomutase
VNTIHPRAGQPAAASDLVDLPKLITAYFSDQPDPRVPEQRVAFGTSGHRGSSFDRSFNEWHILAITQAICLYRREQKVDGPLFLGIDTHALSRPALASAMEVLAGNNVDVMLAERTDYTPTPAVSHAILTYNLGRKSGLAALRGARSHRGFRQRRMSFWLQSLMAYSGFRWPRL